MVLARTIQADAASAGRNNNAAALQTTTRRVLAERRSDGVVKRALPPGSQGRVLGHEASGQARYGMSFPMHDRRDDQHAAISARMLDVWPGVAVTILNGPPIDAKGIATNAGQLLRTPVRGGLPPRVLRRVCEYIDRHVEENISIKDLAEVAGLSRFHFLRAFKQSQGMTPHCYVFQRRLEYAKRLLSESELSLSEVAVAAGFADQSHFARRFRRYVGTTPARFRWSLR